MARDYRVRVRITYHPADVVRVPTPTRKSGDVSEILEIRNSGNSTVHTVDVRGTVHVTCT